jgi:phage terminase Nu1 subunit (DNA packaging protein)
MRADRLAGNVAALHGWVTTNELAELWSVHSRTLQRWRKAGTGPPWFRAGRRVFYDRAQLAGYLDDHEVVPEAPLWTRPRRERLRLVWSRAGTRPARQGAAHNDGGGAAR